MEKFLEKNTLLDFKDKQSPMGHDYILMDGEVYNVASEVRGTYLSTKYWLLAYEPTSFKFIKKYFFKSTFNSTQLPSVSEVVNTQILNKLGVETVDCALATLKQNNMNITGIISKNYITGDNIVEVSGRDLINQYEQYVIKNKIDNPLSFKYRGAYSLNYVEDYITIIQTLYKNENINIESIKTNLLKIVIYDYLRGNTDRHANNISFLIDTKIGYSSLKLAPFYDFDHTVSTIVTTGNKLIYVSDFLGINNLEAIIKKQKEVDSVVKNTNIRLLVKRINPDIIGEFKLIQDKKMSKQTLTDIASAIIENEEVYNFYKAATKKNLVKEKLRKIQEFTPDLTEIDIEFENEIFKRRRALLQENVQKLLSQKRIEMENNNAEKSI